MAYADLVEQETTTTGTGTYTVSGTAPAGRRTWLQGFPDDTPGIPYVVTDDAGNFECSFGNWDNAGTLTRTKVLASSNGGAAVNWAAGTKRIYCGAHSGVMGMSGVRHNLNAVAAPDDEVDDFSQGYGGGSIWSYNKAAWIYISGSGWTNLTPTIDENNNRYVEVKKANGDVGLRLHGVGAVHMGVVDQGLTIGGNDITRMFGTFFEHESTLGVDTPWTAFTADATPKRMEFFKDGSTYDAAIYMSGSGVLAIEALVLAANANTPTTVKAWKVTIAAVNDGAGTVTLGTPTITELYEAAGATGWVVAFAIATDGSSGNGDGVTLNVTGQAATDILWRARVTGFLLVP